jgi:hypothetical protein
MLFLRHGADKSLSCCRDSAHNHGLTDTVSLQVLQLFLETVFVFMDGIFSYDSTEYQMYIVMLDTSPTARGVTPSNKSHFANGSLKVCRFVLIISPLYHICIRYRSLSKVCWKCLTFHVRAQLSLNDQFL